MDRASKRTGIWWWGYIHTNGTHHAKRYFDKLDIADALTSPFVSQVYGPIEGTREGLLKLMEEH
jgi:hypothetical protein